MIIEPVLALFQVQVERMRRHPMKFLQAMFGRTPEVLYPVDVARASGKLVASMITPIGQGHTMFAALTRVSTAHPD